MGLLDTYRISKIITSLLAIQDPTSAEALQAIEALKRFGKAAIPKLIDALGRAPQPQVLLGLLSTLLQDATFPLYGDGLASSNGRVVSGVVEVLAQSTTYNPTRLLELLTDPRISKVTLSKLLAVHRQELDPEALLRCLDSSAQQDRPLLLSLLHQVAREDMVPELIQRLASPDDTVRVALTRTLTRFRTEAVRDALQGLLGDSHAPVRMAALDGLASLRLPLDIASLCHVLRDSERGIRHQASLLLAQLKDPHTVSHLFDVLQDESPDVQRGAVDLLNAVGSSGIMRQVVTAHQDTEMVRDTLLRLLEAPHPRVRQVAMEGLQSLRESFDAAPICQLLWDPDRTVRRQAVAMLTQREAAQMLPTLRQVLQDDAPEIRQGAVAVLNAISDVQVVRDLLIALQGEEWWVVHRTVDALGRQGSPKLIDAALRLIADEDAFVRRHILEILKLSQAPQIVDFLIGILSHESSWARTCAAEALGMLEEQGRGAVPTLLRIAEGDEQSDDGLIALRTLTKLKDPRAIPVGIRYLQSDKPAMQEEGLQALLALTDAEHAETVLQTIMNARHAITPTLKEQADQTAAALAKRFGDLALGKKSSLSLATNMSRLTETATDAPLLQSLLRDVSPHDGLQSEPPRSVPRPMPAAAMPASAMSYADPEAETVMDATALAPGRVLGGRYHVIRRVGQGGFGTVVLVMDAMVKEELILKFLNPQLASDERMIQRFIHELRYARRVTHENVIRIHDFLQVDNAYAISMEYFASHNLGAELRDRKPMEWQRSLRVVWHICRGMSAAHQAHIIHRDLKPANVLISDDGIVKIVDFGLAAAATDAATRLTRTGALLGTPLYMAPEQVQNSQIDARADIYSLGIMLYEMCTGRPPYLGNNTMAVLFQHVEGKATPPRVLNPELPPELEAIIQKAMALAPDQRFQTMEEFGKSLLPLLRQQVRS